MYGFYCSRWSCAANLAALAVALVIFTSCVCRAADPPASPAATAPVLGPKSRLLPPVDTSPVGPTPKIVEEYGERRLRASDGIKSVQFTADGRSMVSIAYNGRPKIQFWDVDSGLPRDAFPAGAEPANLYGPCALSPDGARLICADYQGTVFVWDVRSQSILAQSKLHDGPLSGIAVSPDGKQVATLGQRDGVVKLQSLDQTDKPLWQASIEEAQPRIGNMGMLMADATGVGKIAFSPDGAYVACVSFRGKITVLEADGGNVATEPVPLPGDDSAAGFQPQSVAFLPGGATILAAGYRQFRREQLPVDFPARAKNVNLQDIRVMGVATGEFIKNLTQDQLIDGQGAVALSPDGKQIAAAAHEKIRLLNVETGEVIREIQTDSYGFPAFSPDGRLLAVPSGVKINLYRAETGERLHHDGEVRHPVETAIYGPKDDTLITFEADGILKVRDLETNEITCERQLGPGFRVEGLDTSVDGQTIAVCGVDKDMSGKRKGMAVVVSVKRADISRIALPRFGNGVAVSPIGDRVAVTHTNGAFGDARIEIWGGEAMQKIAEFPRDPANGLTMYRGMQFAPDDRYLWIAEYDGTITRWDTSPAAEDTSFIAEWRPHDKKRAEKDAFMARGVFTSDGKLLVTATYNNLYVWNLESHELERKITPTNGACRPLSLAADNRTLACSEVDSFPEPGYGSDAIHIVDITTGEILRRWTPETGRMYSLAISPDGSRLLTHSSRGITTFWDLSQ